MNIFEVSNLRTKGLTWDARLSYLGNEIAFVYSTGEGLKYAPMNGKALTAARLHALSATSDDDLDSLVMKMVEELR
jgi:hypothetical protein